MVTTSLKEPPSDQAATRLRDQVIEILDLINVPTPRRLLQDVLACRGVAVDPGQLSRLRGAEERAFRASPTDATCWLLPAISCLDLTAIPGTFTCSTWILEARLVGVHTPRARHLRVLLRLLDETVELDAERGQRLLARLAETVPGAMERGRMRDLMKVPCVAIANAARWSWSDATLYEPFDLQIVDEAFQLPDYCFHQIANLGRRLVLVGDPGQIAPVVTCEIERWVSDPVGPHVACARIGGPPPPRSPG
jgi:hypothetical protein